MNLPDLKPNFLVALEVASGAISEFGIQVEDTFPETIIMLGLHLTETDCHIIFC